MKDKIDILLENLKYDIIGMEDSWLRPGYNIEKIYKLLKKEYRGAENIMENKEDVVNHPNHYTNGELEQSFQIRMIQKYLELKKELDHLDAK